MWLCTRCTTTHTDELFALCSQLLSLAILTSPTTNPSKLSSNILVSLIQVVWLHGKIMQQLTWIIVVLLPKGGGDYRGIGLLETIWKVVERIMDWGLNIILLYEVLHGCCDGCGMGTAMIEAKLVQQLSHLEQEPFYGVFLGLKKAFNTKEREGCLLILEGYGAGPNTVCLICIFWQEATLVCCVSDHYGGPF